jgi:NADPH:quinone reductase-like Zn-dependent oxidoreductase
LIGEAIVRAVRLHDDGIRLDQIRVPRPTGNEVLVRVHAAGITRDELTWPVDRLPAIPSYELPGVVVAIGSHARGVAADDEVFALMPFDRDGVEAEYAVVPACIAGEAAIVRCLGLGRP